MLIELAGGTEIASRVLSGGGHTPSLNIEHSWK
jgi:hypothetical protein